MSTPRGVNSGTVTCHPQTCPGVTPPQVIALVAFLFSAAVTAAFMAMPFFVLNQLGGGAALAGIFTGVQALGYTLTSLASSRFVARAANGLAWSVFGMAGFMALICCMPFFRTPWICCAFFTGAFTMSAFAWPAFHSWVGAEHVPEKRARYMGLINVAWSVGGAVGPFIAGPLYEADYRYPFVFVALVCLLSLALVRIVPGEKIFFGTASAEMVQLRASHDRASESFLWGAWCATFTAHISVGSTRAVFPKRLDDIINAGQLRLLWENDAPSWLNAAAATRFSWLVVALGLATGLTFFVMGRTGWWHHRFSALAVVQLFTGLSMWCLGFTHSLVLMLLAFAVIGANLGVAFFSSVYYSMANPDRKHGRAAINEGVVGLGGMVGSFGFAALGFWFGLETPFYLMPLVMGGIIVLEWALIRKSRLQA